MKESDLSKVLKSNSLKFEMSVYFKDNKYNFYSVSTLSKFLREQISLWDKDIGEKTLWKENINILNKVNDLLNILENDEKVEESAINDCIDSIKELTYRTPYFKYNKRAVSYLNQVYCSEQYLSESIIKQFITQDGINTYNNNFKLSSMFNYIVGIIANENNVLEEAMELNEKIVALISYTDKKIEELFKEKNVIAVELNNKAVALISNTEEKIKEIIQEQSVLFKETNKTFLTMIDERNTLSEKTLIEHNTKFCDIEKTYEEKVRIAKPSELWENKKKQYSNRGGWWTFTSIVFSLLICSIGIIFFIYFPDIFSNKQDEGLKITGSVKWLILTSVGIGSLIYLLRLSVKLALSSFHMSRDAEEKCALTSFYLSLINDKKLDPENEKELKNIVMNALFARVETGLLKGDNSPTIPTAGLSEAVRLVSGKQT